MAGPPPPDGSDPGMGLVRVIFLLFAVIVASLLVLIKFGLWPGLAVWSAGMWMWRKQWLAVIDSAVGVAKKTETI